MFPLRGKSIRLSAPRKLVGDLVHFAHKIPTVPVQRIVNVAALEEARSQLRERPGWCAIFTKAYALVAMAMPELRRAYIAFPWARLYEHPCNCASIAFERLYHEENGVFFAYVRQPETMSLMDLEEELRRNKDEPVEVMFRFSIVFSRFPRFIRRFLWWYLINVRGSRKAQFLGTFGVSVYASLGAESLHPLSPLTTLLNYGIISPEGTLPVRIIYDHRAMDGATIARALARLEKVLNEEVLAELRSLQNSAVVH
ncbi:MAG: hypothetical protein HY040_23390 [Planctomycetes bacterium]|nr:hypothetical protein [Planctomycetota bacterium]